ncbi:MAG TPA: hypothetical protein VK663_06535 [Burkholderiales bacterium]|nr:hypothetical protein [Burkholderiales bacterium]
MKIENVNISVVRVMPDTAYEAGGRAVDAYWPVLAEVTTSDGMHGFDYVIALVRPVSR